MKKALYLVLALGIVLLIGISDYVTEEKISFYVFYSFPIFIAAWYVGSAAGILICFASSLSWFLADLKDAPSPDSLAYFDATLRLTFFIAISLVLSQLHESLESEKKFARTDYLTGLPNRRTFIERASLEMERVRRYNHPFTIAYIDLDNFKPVNDQFGHEVGDGLLRNIAKALRYSTRGTDSLARIGGDEFLILFPETDAPSAHAIIEKIQKQLDEVPEVKRHRVTVSIGAVTYHHPPMSPEDMIKEADRIMYEAKATGKNTIRYLEVDDAGKLG